MSLSGLGHRVRRPGCRHCPVRSQDRASARANSPAYRRHGTATCRAGPSSSLRLVPEPLRSLGLRQCTWCRARSGRRSDATGSMPSSRAGRPMASGKVSARQLANATWVLREPGSGTREAADRWLMPQLPEMKVELELSTNEAVKRAVAAGIGLGCLSALAVEDAVRHRWLVQLPTTFPTLHRTLSIVLNRSKKLGSAADGFLRYCTGAK
jgi:hypothetical protein